MLLGKFDHLLSVKQDRFVCFYGEQGTASLVHGAERTDPDRGHVEPHILLRLGNFYHCEAPCGTELPRAAYALVCSLYGFHRQHGAAFDGYALPHIQSSHFSRQLPTKLDVFRLAMGQTASGQDAMFHE